MDNSFNKELWELKIGDVIWYARDYIGIVVSISEGFSTMGEDGVIFHHKDLTGYEYVIGNVNIDDELKGIRKKLKN